MLQVETLHVETLSLLSQRAILVKILVKMKNEATDRRYSKESIESTTTRLFIIPIGRDRILSTIFLSHWRIDQI